MSLHQLRNRVHPANGQDAIALGIARTTDWLYNSGRMLRSIFGRKKRKRDSSALPPRDDSIRDARVGDVVSIAGFRLEYEDVYFYVERVHRYSGHGETWHEVVCTDGHHQVWVDWVDGHDLFVTATDNPDPSGLASVGLTEETLIELDEENSIDNHIEVEGEVYRYRNSSETLFYQDGRGAGQGFYSWDFIREQGDRVMSVAKWEGRPFEVTFSEVIPPENITLYPGDRGSENRSRPSEQEYR